MVPHRQVSNLACVSPRTAGTVVSRHIPLVPSQHVLRRSGLRCSLRFVSEAGMRADLRSSPLSPGMLWSVRSVLLTHVPYSRLTREPADVGKSGWKVRLG